MRIPLLLWGSLVLWASACGVVPKTPEEEVPVEEEPFAEDEYTACGCGCCAGVKPGLVCLAEDGGAALEEIVKRDRVAQRDPSCPVAGCSFGTTYRYCERTPDGG